MKSLKEKIVNISSLIENQFPQFVAQENSKFISFLSSYYESQETKYQPLDIVSNIIDYYNIGYFSKSQLVENTELSSDVTISDSVITVKSTLGFPEKNGYIQINNEYIFYRTKTSTQFKNCVRGTSALVLENIPYTELVLNSSELNTDTNQYSHEHLTGDKVVNLSYYFAAEFFRRIRFEISPTLPENLVDELDISSFLKQVKSFYTAKGSLNSHQILFRILFNDKRIKIRTKERGTGAKFKIINNGGQIGYILPDNSIIGVEIVSGGVGYDSRKVDGVLKNSPIVEISGSGTGEKDLVTNILPKSAIIEVTDINSSGTITSINIKNRGQNYEGPINARIRERSFDQDQLVRNISGTGIGRVENWDETSGELILYDTVGYFRVNDEIVADTGEKPSIFIEKIYPTSDVNKKGNPSIEVLPAEVGIEFPKEYTIKPSSASYYKKRIIKCELFKNSVYKVKDNKKYLPQLISFVQEKDSVFGVKGVVIESSAVLNLNDNIFKIEIETNSDYKNIYLPPSTKIITSISSISSATSPFTLTVDNTAGFPVVDGFIVINSNIIEYQSKSGNQFFGCKYSGTATFNILVGDDVYCYGRKKSNISWQSNQKVTSGEYRFYGENLYVSKTDGNTKNVAPTHTKGIKSDGTFGVKWEYISKNIFLYFLTGYIDGNYNDTQSPEFRIVGLASDIEIEEPGSLYTSQIYEFVDKLESSKTSPIYTSWNINRTGDTIDNSSLPSFKNTTGIDSLYEYEDNVYVSSSGIPSYLNSVTVSDATRKNATNQKLVKRIRKNTSSNRTSSSESSRGIGITVDGVEIQSTKGNIISYGSVTKFIIQSKGDYVVPIATSNLSFDILKYPVLNIEGYNANPVKNTSTNTLYFLNSRISSINTDNIPINYLNGFTSAPRVIVENNNPFKSAIFNNTSVNYSDDSITITAHSFETGDKVKYSNIISPIGGLVDQEYYYVRKINNNTISLFYSKDDAILGILSNKVNFTTIPNTATFTAQLKTDNTNPIDFEEAQIDVSYVNGKIDRFIVRNTGKGYIVAPTLRIVGGGKDFSGINSQFEIIPFKNPDGQDIVVFKGGLISAANFDGDNWNEIPLSAEIGNNFDKEPLITVNFGSGASATAYTSNGQISTIQVDTSGLYYYSKPTVVINGVGSNAAAEAFIDSDGKVTQIKIINSGSGYFINPSISIVPAGVGGSVSGIIKTWTFNIASRFANVINNYGGYVFKEVDDDPKGSLNSVELKKLNLSESLDDSQYLIVKTTSNLNNHYGITNTQHSPIIGWSYDGHPIYGKYGYSNKFNASSSIVALNSGWTLKSSRLNGPSVSDYPLGSFIEDYTPPPLNSNLDEYNGRFCVTPEFPNGVYAYFATDDYPYFVGPKYFSKFDSFNINGCRRNDKIPYFYDRINDKNNPNYPKERKSRDKTLLFSKVLAKGSVDSVIIENSGVNYNVGDKLVVNNELTYGTGFSAFVSRVTGKQISSYEFLSNTTKIKFNTVSSHGLSVGDYVYFNYVKNNFYTTINLSGPNQSSLVSQSTTIAAGGPLQSTNFYQLNLNKQNSYRLVELNYESAIFSYDRENLNPFYDTSIEIESVISGQTTGITLDASKLPSIVYLHVNGKVFEITTSISQLFGEQRIVEVPNAASFVIDKSIPFIDTNLSNIFYIAKSYGATGSIADVVIVNPGSGYKKLPEIVRVESKFGNGAIIQANSKSIGKLTKIDYVSVGDEFTSNRNINYEVNLNYTAKIINNFKIDKITVDNGGIDYVTTDLVSVNGSYTFGKFNILSETGTITEIKVLDGGSNLDAVPEILVTSQNGSGASFTASIVRKEIYANDIITFGSTGSGAPSAKVVDFDVKSSTIEFSQINGAVKEGDLIYTSDGILYGKIIFINRGKAIAKSSSYVNFPEKFLNNSGFLNDNSQRILDSKFYQEWSYLISSNRNTKEWMYDVLRNTHASGFKAFGKNILEKRKSVFTRPEDIFKSSVIFTVSLDNTLDLRLKTTPCKTQTIFLFSTSNFAKGQYVFGTTTETLGLIENISETSITLSIIDGSGFVAGESVVIVSNAINLTTSIIDNNTLKSLIFVNGILQQPFVSYSISENSFIPRFPLFVGDDIVGQFFTTEYSYLDPGDISNTGQFALSKNGQTFIPTGGVNKNKLIISIAGVIQNPDNFSVTGNVVTLSSTPEQIPSSRTFSLYHENLQKLTFAGNSIGSTFTINATPPGNCRLIVFYSSIGQTHLLTDYTISGNQITFSEPVELSNIFGWYISESATCEIIDTSSITANTILSVYKVCRTNNYTQFIESNNQKNVDNFYEFEKEIIDGTVYPNSTVSYDIVYGFDSRFRYSNPEYSTSYVEVLDKIKFDGINIEYKLTNFCGLPYSPIQNKGSVVVYINNQVLDPSLYDICDDNIRFATVYPEGTDCGIIDFRSSYLTSKNKFSRKKGANLDKLNVSFNANRNTFNLSDNGVPTYVNNIGDLFVIRNGVLQKPSNISHTIDDNKITFIDAPEVVDNINILRFNRQLAPQSTKNLILDSFRCFDGIRTNFPLTVSGETISPDSSYDLFVIREGIVQTPEIDYFVIGTTIEFTTAPTSVEDIKLYYFNNGVNNNKKLTHFYYFDGIRNDFGITVSNQSQYPQSADNLIIIRNGIYQYPKVDFDVVNSRVSFANAPLATDDIFSLLLNFNTVEVFSNNYTWTSTRSGTDYLVGSEVVRSRGGDVVVSNTNPLFDEQITQVSAQVIQLAKSPNINLTSQSLLIFIDGIIQEDNTWTYNNTTKQITFSESVSVVDKEIHILWVKFSNVIDTITMSSGTLSYNMTDNGTSYSPATANSLFVTVNGVIQKPGTSYTISGNVITFAQVTDGSVVYIRDFTTSGLVLVDDYDDAVDGIKSTFKLQDNYVSFDATDVDDLLVIRNSIVQNPTQDFTTGNGYITFTTTPTPNENIIVIDTYDSVEISVTSVVGNTLTVGSAIPTGRENDLILFINGVPQIYGTDFTYINSTQITLTNLVPDSGTTIYAILFKNLEEIDSLEDCVNGTRTQFKLLYNNVTINASEVTSDADILVVKNGVIQQPSIDYSISGNRRHINFTTPLLESDDFFLVKMYGNTLVSLTPVGSSSTNYTLNTNISNPERLLVISNGVANVPGIDYTFDSGFTNKVTLNIPRDSSSPIFGIRFSEVVSYMDEINTPYDSTRTTFNMFLEEENFIPVGTIDNDNTPSASSILVFKNGKVLESIVDYTLSGTIYSRISFTTAPSQSDVISVKTVGAFDKLDTITTVFGGNTYYLKKNGADYYPNATIARPREHENQILVIKDGEIQNPLKDYYIDNNKIMFNFNVTASKLVVLDFIGTSDDVKVDSYSYQVNVGDEIQLSGESGRRKITNVTSPTVLQTESYSSVIIGDTIKLSTTIEGNNTLKSLIFVNGILQQPFVSYTVSQNSFAPKFSLVDTDKVIGQFTDTEFTYLDPTTISIGQLSLTKNNQNFIPANKDKLIISVGGAVQNPNNFTISGNVITFSAEQIPSTRVFVLYQENLQKLTFAGNASGTTFTLNVTPSDNNRLIIFYSALNQTHLLNEYTISGNQITFSQTVELSNIFGWYVNELTTSEIISTASIITNVSPGKSYYGFSGTLSGKVIDIVSGGYGYPYPTILRTQSSGTSARFVATPNRENGYTITANTISSHNYGCNVPNVTPLIPTTYAYIVRKQLLSSNDVRKGTKLSSNIDEKIESITLATTAHLSKNTPIITISSSTGSGAILKPYVCKGKIRKIQVVNAGIGYNDMDMAVTLSGGGGTGCILEPVLDAMGSFVEVIVQNPGSGFDTFRVIIDNELIEYTDISGSSITQCSRGVIGLPVSHTQDTIVYSDNYL